MITCDNENKTESPELVRFFSLRDTRRLWNVETLAYTDFLEKLVFRIARKPNSLITHIQRIYYAFHTDANAQLFAAIVDFLVILNRRGAAISWRIVMGAKSRLNADQFKILKNYLKDEQADANTLSGNQYSILTRGMLGFSDMVQQLETKEEAAYDPLELARDYIEYSQLAEAKQVLEKAIMEPSARLDVHYELLALYQSTRDSTGFRQMLATLIQSAVAIPEEWKQLNTYFEGQNTNG